MTLARLQRSLSPLGFRCKRAHGLIVLWFRGQSWNCHSCEEAFDIACDIVGGW